ncbi:thioredoxin domain-containing protein [Desulfovibrio subterraneus]|uniref:protein-disulfide reductase DsbD family protein n=1 Tax=Desulfovibrio subterraneus TaxID=2718620 RepID=UPI0022B9216A|nr:cytochrome c biogenesis protein CcdA [Desulfovibrio subterraneus]WBF67345.1 thioredoxin domain-containing protein [Desulfovibrio subterraneus]
MQRTHHHRFSAIFSGLRPYTPAASSLVLLAVLALFITAGAASRAFSAQKSTLPVSFRTEVFRLNSQLPTAGNALSGTAAKGASILVAVWIEPQEGYHFYANDPGDSGRPTDIVPAAPSRDMTLLYPVGIAAKDVFDPAATVMIHETATPFFIHLPDGGTAGSLPFAARLLLCSDSNCWPVHEKLTAEWNEENTPLATAETQAWWPTLARYTAKPALQSETAAVKTAPDVTALAQELGVSLPSSGTKSLGQDLPQPGAGKAPGLGQTGSAKETTGQATGLNAGTAPSATSVTPSSPTSVAVPLKKTQGTHSPFFSPDSGYSLSPRYHMQSLEVTTIGAAIFFGLLAGFILNFMPCVLPVISLKLSSLVSASGIIDEHKRMASFREHNIWFALGIMVWFFMLAAIFLAAGTAWGQLFQDERLVTGLMLLMFALGLSTFGIFELPMLALHGSTAQQSGKWSAFSTGLLATLLATPCSGPFLGGVLGWAFLQPPLVLAAILLAVGSGMALPYAGMAIFPGLVRHFPKPGNWTVVLQRVVGFFLMGTTGYLLTILPADNLPFLLALLWVTALAAWLWGTFADFNAPRGRRWLVRSLCVALIALPLVYDSTPTTQSIPWKPFRQEQFLSSLGKENMLVDFTADWCPNCKILESTVLTADNRTRWAAEYGITYIKVDLTRHNEEGQALLKALGSQSIPVVALFPKGDKASRPLVLRDLFTTDLAESALKEVFGN